MIPDKMIETLLNNAPLVVPLGLLYWWATPRIIKSTLMNGGGDILRRVMREANAEQSIENAESFAKVRERMAALETRVKDHLDRCTK